jgi:hypothetical protein
MTVTCPNGHPVTAGQRFCPECGAAVGENEMVQTATGELPTAPPASPPRRNRTLLIIAAAVGVVLVTVFLIVFLGSKETHLIQGELSLFDSDTASNNCVGTGGYDDIAAGVSVTVRDGTGSTLATGRLEKGEALAGIGCTYKFDVEVPDVDFYRVEVAHRGELEYSKAELERNNWKVNASLGDIGS